jgi:L-2-hydroxyglutarate oxidase LhgO
LRADRLDLVRGLIYPVPDPAYPFLGVHFTRRVGGGVDIGPNAVPALAKEGYRRRDVDLSELRAVLSWPGSRALARRHWRMGAAELAGSLSRRVLVRRAQRYVPALRLADAGSVTAVRNAPSPGATSSLAIAEHICDAVLG